MIDVIFAFFNLALVVGIIAYLSYKHFIPSLRAKVAEEEEHQQSMHEEHHQLILKKKQLDESIIAQEAYCANLFKKIDQWRKDVEAEKREVQKEKAEYLDLAHEKRGKQSHTYALRAYYKQLVPEVHGQLERDLQAYYTDKSKMHAYTQKTLKQIKASS